MAQAMNRKPLFRWNSNEIVEFSDNSVSFTNTNFDVFNEDDESLRDSIDLEEEDDGNDNSCNVEENKKFWETQNQLLKESLYKTSSIETKIRQSTKEALKEINNRNYCVCGKTDVGGCRSCLRREVSLWLQREGFNCYICKSKWRSSQEMISGEHEYLEVVDRSNQKKGEVRVIVELNFRAEFEMSRAGEDYSELINRLPEVFVGKTERLKACIKILCAAAKKCMKDKKMHLGPWRKHKYMQSKWLGTCERTSLVKSLPLGFSDRPRKQIVSMLTNDLVENLPVLHCTAVKVL